MFDLTGTILRFIFIIPAVLISLTVHEYFHGYVSYLLGDHTAKSMGRLTLNPIRHIDPVGFIAMVIFKFGWAKPVPINTYYYKNRRLGVFLVSIAGPLSNIILAFVAAVLYRLIPIRFGGGNSLLLLYAYHFVRILISLNLTLAVFNLIPIPPLDGSKILMSILPQKYAAIFVKYEKYSNILLIILLFTGAMSGFINSAVNMLLTGIFAVINIFPFL